MCLYKQKHGLPVEMHWICLCKCLTHLPCFIPAKHIPFSFPIYLELDTRLVEHYPNSQLKVHPPVRVCMSHYGLMVMPSSFLTPSALFWAA